MGYLTRIQDELRIEPPLRWADYRGSQWEDAETAREHGKTFYLVETRDTEDTDDGPLERRQAVAVACAWHDWTKMYDDVKDLQELVDAFPHHRFVGVLQGQGTQFGDIWRLRVVESNGRWIVVREQPTTTWPDGTMLERRQY
jgi:hypothetical protein